jgi:hypothetical protein
MMSLRSRKLASRSVAWLLTLRKTCSKPSRRSFMGITSHLGNASLLLVICSHAT